MDNTNVLVTKEVTGYEAPFIRDGKVNITIQIKNGEKNRDVIRMAIGIPMAYGLFFALKSLLENFKIIKREDE